MSSRGRKIRRQPTAASLRRAKVEFNQQHHSAFGTPHFPPAENLPPQAKRLDHHKPSTAARTVPGRSPPLAAIPPALSPLQELAQVLLDETFESLDAADRHAQPVIQGARNHLKALRLAWRALFHELRAVAEIPVDLARAVFTAG